MADLRKHRTVSLHPERIAELMRARGWSIEKLSHQTGLSPGSVSAVLNGKHPVHWSTAEKFRIAFNLKSIDELVDLPSNGQTSRDRIHEWLLANKLGGWITASNQLQFRLWKLKHVHLAKFARGKCYELHGMAAEERKSCHAALLRHAEVCLRVGKHANLINNLTTFESPSHDAWWVIDEWIEGKTLREVLVENPLPCKSGLAISHGIARALHALHCGGIIRRELAPQSILIESDSNRPVLTELELAKLLDGSPTVSAHEWPLDPYRAPEADSDDIDLRSDVYSWGRVTLHMLLGRLPEEGEEPEAMKNIDLPKHLVSLLTKCVSTSRRSRPSGFLDILPIVEQTVTDNGKDCR